MIWSNPTLIPPGKKIHSLLSSIDFAPTVCELCGIEPLPSFRGCSYAKLLTSSELEVRTQLNKFIFTELTYHDVYNPMRAIRSERYKYIRNFESEKVPLVESIPVDIRHNPSWQEWVVHGRNTHRLAEEFYDLIEDPLEEHNFVNELSDHPELRELKKTLHKFLSETGDLILDGPYPVPDGARIDNAKDFDHIPEFITVTNGKLYVSGSDSLVLNMQFSPDNPTRYDVDLVEILDEYLNRDITFKIGTKIMNGRLVLSDDGNNLFFIDDSGGVKSSLLGLLGPLIDLDIVLAISRMSAKGGLVISFRSESE
ncbi:MAG: sulfatase/phosphatase domain-containing protein [Promethearchaeota archaeon]